MLKIKRYVFKGVRGTLRERKYVTSYSLLTITELINKNDVWCWPIQSSNEDEFNHLRSKTRNNEDKKSN